MSGLRAACVRPTSDDELIKKPTHGLSNCENGGMNNRNQNITETRDWAKMIVALTLGIAVIILAIRGELGGAALMAGLAGIRQRQQLARDAQNIARL